ncbi:hypothetical protein IU443_21490 [Nocardia farcinica]|uniref:hypothetical protein n=1 Tax=Nocardia farcinica TaxID=37329 RepID=UPI001893CAC6|nr:hypothetical protein [Nocardia farcinica]MBF6071912.1 hypothetical protein [Nocardia farcinica]MBF6141596.1 hypothetical protein [Nocardia farcinica]MBF6253135.1 hypothetical protein [Nocardia farcinica]MBF6264847.1 hypothetical protein [Nocardia farcinica]MBF6283633.1 hypothetical protein [Nocardia farcinica]
MSVQVVNSSRILSDRCEHQARAVGGGRWVVSFLPGRTLTLEQAVSAVQLAEFTWSAAELAHALGLTAREAVHFALTEPAWPACFFRDGEGRAR